MSLGPVTSDMSDDEKVIRWATRYCSDPGAGPSPTEQVAIDAVVAKLETIATLTAERDQSGGAK